MKNEIESRKTAMLMSFLLMGLVLSMGFGLADQGRSQSGIHASDKIKTRGNSVSLSDVNAESDADSQTFGADNLQLASSDIDSSAGKTARESGFAQVSLGQGWAITTGDSNSSEGNFARIFWVKKTFVNSSSTDNSTNTTATSDVTKIKGGLKIGPDMYKLNLTSETDNSMVFDVMSQKDKVNGTLTLNIDKSLVGFTTWTGTLSLDSGKTYTLTLATKDSKVKDMSSPGLGLGKDKNGNNSSDNSSSNESNNGQGKKLGFFARVRGWFGGNK